MTLPHPTLVRRKVKDTIHLLEDSSPNGLVNLYRTAHNFAFHKVRSEEVPVKTSGHSDSTGSSAADKQARMRRHNVQMAAQLIDRAESQLVQARQLLAAAIPDSRSAPTAPEKDSAVGPGYTRDRRYYRDKRKTMPWDGDSAEVV